MRNDFAVLILSHGRADRVYTIPTLRKGGYTGKIYIVVDNEDEQQDEYIVRYGKENVIVFDKPEAMKHSDTMDNYEKHNIVLYARNSCFEIAKRLGLSLIAAGHYATEFPVTAAVAEKLRAALPGVEVLVSTANKDPYTYL